MLWTREILLRDLLSSSSDFVSSSLERFQKRSHRFSPESLSCHIDGWGHFHKSQNDEQLCTDQLDEFPFKQAHVSFPSGCVCLSLSRSLCWWTNGSGILKCDERMCASHSIVTCSTNDVKHVYACNACAKSIWTIRDCLMGCDKKPTNKPNNTTSLFFVRKSRYCRQVSLWQSDNFLLAKHDARGMSLVVTSCFDTNETR